MKNINALWFGLLFLCLLAPLGLLASGDAWGEWGADVLEKMLGYIPKGILKYSEFWKAPLPDYSISGISEFVGYILSALLGVLLVVALTWLLGKCLFRQDRS